MCEIGSLCLGLPPLEELQKESGRLQGAQSEPAEECRRLYLAPQQFSPTPLRRLLLLCVAEVHARQLQNGYVTGRAFRQIPKILNELPELGHCDEIFVRSDKDLFRVPVLDIWFGLQLLLVSAYEVGYLNLGVRQEDESDKGPTMLSPGEGI